MTVRRIAVAAAVLALSTVAAVPQASAQSLLAGGQAKPQLLIPEQSIPWTPPPATPLRCGPFCDMSIHAQTPTEQGAGSTCSNAVTALNSELMQIAKANCINFYGDLGACNLAFTYTIGCTETGGAWNVSGYATYSCRDNSC